MGNLYFYRAKVTRVIDGDTIECLVDLGFSTFKQVTVRLLDLDAPETRTKDLDEKAEGQRITAKLKAKMDSTDFVYMQSERTDSFGRWLAWVYFDDRKRLSVNKMIKRWIGK